MAINDGDHRYAPPHFPPPPVFLFASAPPDELGPALEEHGLSAEEFQVWDSPYTCLLIDTGRVKVLVDTGTGGFVAGTGRLVERLGAHGIGPDDIDLVVVTHAHPDHIGGAVGEDGQPVFGAARVVMSEREVRFWTSDEAERVLEGPMRDLLVGFARKKLGPLEDRLWSVTEETEITPGVRVLPAFGHTPGHLVVQVKSGDDELLFLSDTVLHPVHLRCPHFCGLVDILPAEVEATRKTMLELAARRDCLVLAFHFPFPGLGRISQTGTGWTFRPDLPK